MAKTTVYRIENCSGIRGGAWTCDYTTEAAATEALRAAMGWDEIHTSDRYQVGSEWSRDYAGPVDARSAYATKEECDADEEGAHAPRVVRHQVEA